MKTFRNLWPAFVDFENLWLAYCRARRHKRYTAAAATFHLDMEKNLLALHQELREQRWSPGSYHHFRIVDPKPRRYVRYMDDFLLFDDDKGKLESARAEVGRSCRELRLNLHAHKTQVRGCKQGVKFVGFKLTPQTRRICPESIGRFRRRMRRMGAGVREHAVDMGRVTASVRGWLAHTAHANASAMVSEVLAEVRI